MEEFMAHWQIMRDQTRAHPAPNHSVQVMFASVRACRFRFQLRLTPSVRLRERKQK